MDVDTLRIAVTVISFVTFLGILIWAYSPWPRKGFSDAAMLPFTEDEDGNACDAKERR
ncbi:MAG: cbb3-type cytochrome oxidase subunit 3 [Burkholderiales bacterium]